MSPAKKTVLFDCDTGVDDAVALLYLLGDPDVELCGISTVFGNIDAASAARNSQVVLDVAGRSGVPVAVGAEATLTGVDPELSTWVHGSNGMGDVVLARPSTPPVERSGAELIVGLARRRPGEIHLLATGPLTNLALALRLEPNLPRMVEGVTVMGGAAEAPGNVTARAEANIWHDPEAAQAVLAAPWAVTLVPLDATMGEVITEEQRRRLLASERPTARLAGEILDFYFDFYTSVYGTRCSACHDVLAAAVAVGDVDPVRSMTVDVTVDTGYGPGRGETIVDTRGRYRGETVAEGARHRVVLDTGGTFAERVVTRLLGG